MPEDADELRDKFRATKANKDMEPTAEMGAPRDFTPEKPKSVNAAAPDAYTPDEKAWRVLYTFVKWVLGDVWWKC